MSSILRSILAENEKTSTYEGYSFEKYNYEQDFIEVFDDYNEILANQDAVERLHEIHDGLESIIKISEESLEEGGLNARNSYILGICSNILVAPLGIENPILSPDAFGVSSEALSATTSAVEKQKGTIGKIWDAIRNAMVAIKNKIKTWYKNIRDVAGKIEAKNNVMFEDVEKLEGKTIPDDKKEIEFNASSLLSDDQNQDELVENMSTLMTATSIFVREPKQIDDINAMLKVITEAKLSDDDSDEGDDIISRITDLVKSYLTVPTLDEYNDIPKSMEMANTDIKKYGLLPGNKSIYVYGSSIAGQKLVDSGYKIGPFRDGYDTKKVKFEVLSIKDMRTLLNFNAIILKDLIESKKDTESRDNVREYIIKAGDNIIKSKISSKRANNLFKLLKMLERFTNSPYNELFSLAVKTINSVINLVGTMVKQYS